MDGLVIHRHSSQAQSFGWRVAQLMEESKKYVDSNLIQTATTTANSLCKYKEVIPTITSSISGQQKYPFCSNLAEITPKLVQYLHSGQNISLDAVINDAVHEQV